MLEDQIRKRLELHIKQGGLITGPDKLLDAVLKEIAYWLMTHERDYRDADAIIEAETLRDLRVNLFTES